MSKSTIRNGALLIALILIVVAFYIRLAREERALFLPSDQLVVGTEGSEHSHASLLVFVEGELQDFSQPRYQLQARVVHFEDGDGVVVHKHATGVSLPLFFETLGWRLNASCLVDERGQEYCSGETQMLRIFLNRELYTGDISLYELRKGDKILIDYSGDSELELLLKVNGVPNLPPDL